MYVLYLFQCFGRVGWNLVLLRSTATLRVSSNSNSTKWRLRATCVCPMQRSQSPNLFSLQLLGHGLHCARQRDRGAPQIHDADVGKIIGTGGANIRELQRGTGCRIDIPRKREETEEVALHRTRTKICAV